MVSDEQLRYCLPASVVALAGDLIRGLAWGTVVLLWLTFGQIYVRLYLLTLGDPSHSDFSIFYYTARMVRAGLPMYGTPPSEFRVPGWVADHYGNLNPPHVQFLLQPLGFFSYGTALAIWALANLAALAFALWLIARGLDIPLTWR